MAGNLYIDNDHSLYLIGLQTEGDYSYKTNATVTGTIVDEPGGTAVTGGGPETLVYIDPSTDTVGGTTADPTVVKATSKMDLQVTVGATNGLDLSIGRLVRILHDDTVWQVRRAVAAAAAADVWIHLEPLIWSGSKPTKVKATTGELIEIVDGTYKATIDKTFSVVDGTTYYVHFVAAVPGGTDGDWYEELEAGYRLS